MIKGNVDGFSSAPTLKTKRGRSNSQWNPLNLHLSNNEEDIVLDCELILIIIENQN